MYKNFGIEPRFGYLGNSKFYGSAQKIYNNIHNWLRKTLYISY